MQAALEQVTAAGEEATRRAATAQARADGETQRAKRAEAQAESVRQQLDFTRDQAAHVASQLAVITTERDAARRDVQRERDHADQRVADLRALHEDQIAQLRQDMAHLQTELRAQRSRRANRAGQTAEAKPVENLRSPRSERRVDRRTDT